VINLLTCQNDNHTVKSNLVKPANIEFWYWIPFFKSCNWFN